MSINKCIFSGTVGKIDVREGENGKGPIAKFSMAVKKSYVKDENKKYNFLNCVAFGSTAKTIATYVKEKDFIEIEAEFETDDYVDKDGNKRYSNSFRVDRMHFVPKQNLQPEGQASSQPPQFAGQNMQPPQFAQTSQPVPPQAPQFTQPAPQPAPYGVPSNDGFTIPDALENDLPWNN